MAAAGTETCGTTLFDFRITFRKSTLQSAITLLARNAGVASKLLDLPGPVGLGLIVSAYLLGSWEVTGSGKPGALTPESEAALSDALAKESGVSVRMIQHYEQRQKDLGKAQAKTVWLLARALKCSVEDLMEF